MYGHNPYRYCVADLCQDAKSAWSVEGYVHPAKAYRPGHLGFKVGEYDTQYPRTRSTDR